MATRSQSVKTSLLRLARAWPADRLRPTLQFGGALQAATARIFDLPPLLATAEKAPNATAPIEEVVQGGKELNGRSLENAEKSLAALSRIFTSSAKHAFPITDKTLVPASYPNHYKTLQEGIDRALRGQELNRGWFSWIRWSRQ